MTPNSCEAKGLLWGCAPILVPRSYPHIPLPRRTNTHIPTSHSFVGRNMSDQSGSLLFQALFESALQDYENQTGIPLASHPLAEQLQNCQSVDFVTTLLQEETQAFRKFRGRDKIIKSLKNVVSALSSVSAAASLGQAVGMVCPRPLIGVPRL
jgi:hypothetical protein